MNRYFINLAYDGSRYHGWQIQPNAITVQGTIEKALSTLLNSTIQITGAGRTDTGVHASDYFAHFDYIGVDSINPEDLTYRLNRFLPPDIVIKKIFEVNKDVHARFSAINRSYTYYISKVKPLFNKDYIHYLYGPLDLDSMNCCCAELQNTTDFTSFSKLHTDTKTNNCKILQIGWMSIENGYRFEITADRFLRDMVRAITGTLLDVGSGKMSVGEFGQIIKAKDRSAAGMSAPAKALFLTSIVYPEGIVP